MKLRIKLTGVRAPCFARFRHGRATFAPARDRCDFLHVVASSEYHPWCPVPLDESLANLKAHGFVAEQKMNLTFSRRRIEACQLGGNERMLSPVRTR